MNRFEIITPADLKQASQLLTEPNRAALAGGVDLVDLMKQDIAAPSSVVNLKGLKELDGIETRPNGDLRLGALVKLSEVAEHPLINSRFTAIAEAAGEAATPQIRNLGTVGGNLLQRPRCWYFRNPNALCLKKGGDTCFSIGGQNRYHAIFGGGPSFIVHPSNLAPALIAFNASAKLVSASGERMVALENFFTLPSVDPKRENDLKPGEILTEVIVPAPPRDARSAYLELREKQSFDWPLVSVAVMLSTSAKRVASSRIVLGAVAPIPWRVPDAEKALAGAAVDDVHARAAAEVALKSAQPMSDNGYKIVIAKVLVRRAILKAAGGAEV
ncbi:MAG TPA: xanthine dehydrogenase family protein subunit M [Candidatus Binataceae bacterium]|nr:xanthine dehydrogenase family protein subunit M [Candidatus Binataceae bacterium]